SEASISQIKKFDDASLAASGDESEARELPGDAGAPAKPQQRKAKTMPATIAEQISAYENQRKTAQDRMTALMAGATDETRTLAEAEAKEYDGLETQTKAISDHISRLERLGQQQKASAVAVVGNGVDAAAASRDVTKASSFIQM